MINEWLDGVQILRQQTFSKRALAFKDCMQHMSSKQTEELQPERALSLHSRLKVLSSHFMTAASTVRGVNIASSVGCFNTLWRETAAWASHTKAHENLEKFGLSQAL